MAARPLGWHLLATRRRLRGVADVALAGALAWALGVLAAAPPAAAAQLAAPAATDTLFDRAEHLVPMRDGVRLHTVVYRPRGRPGPLPVLMQRTPYGADDAGRGLAAGAFYRELAADGYVFVFQDIRGRFGSGGAFDLNRPPRRAGDPRATDESTDAYDTVDWLVRRVPGVAPRVGVLGVSYGGWLAAVAGIGAHPAVKAVSPQAPLADGWIGDDFFHQGAFRQSYGLEYAWMMEASPDLSALPAAGRYDLYDWYRSFQTLGDLARATGAARWPTWRRFADHPAYDSVWQARALTRYATRAAVPTLVVGGWWDQEDMYGALATYAALRRTDSAGRVRLVMGPWAHGQWTRGAADSLGNVRFGRATGAEYRAMEAGWFARWLHGRPEPAGDGAPAAATLFDAGRNEWRRFAAWPPREAVTRRLYLGAGGRLALDAAPAPAPGDPGFDAYVSDPARPVPYRPRPVELTYDPRGSRWSRWLTEDQRFVDGRPDVLTWQTEPLAAELTVAGNVVARLFASTTGSDADWVVKLIDVYPDSVPGRARMGGYQLMVASDVLRGRYRAGFERPAPVAPNAVLPYAVDLHQQAYTFRAGHRVMVQVQSTWFPLYDRNPQTFVPNIFEAPAAAFRAQTHRVHRAPGAASHVEVQVLP